jgi:iron complex outermembrane receptor protein
MRHPLPWPAAYGHRARISLLLVCLLPGPTRAAEPPHDGEAHEEIVVTASPIPKSSDELAVPVNQLDRDHLVSHLGSTLGETLRNEPGITTSGFAPGASRPVVRGQDAFRVRILDNGLGTSDVSAISGDHGVPINPLSARRVEVLRGPATLRYGGGAIAGAVNVLTDRVPRQPVGAPLSGEAFAGYGSVADEGDFSGLLRGDAGPLSWHLDGMLRQSDDYGLPGTSAVQDNTDTGVWSAAGGAAFSGELGRIGFGAQRFENDYGISEPEMPAEAPSIELESQSFDAEADLLLDLGPLEGLRFRGRYTDYQHDEVVQSDAVSKFRADTWEGRLEGLHDAFFGAAGAVGFHFREAWTVARARATSCRSRRRSGCCSTPRRASTSDSRSRRRSARPMRSSSSPWAPTRPTGPSRSAIPAPTRRPRTPPSCCCAESSRSSPTRRAAS